jgi:ATP-dependent RNA helicase DeaD/ATP-dependent RNA helicase RhlE
MTEEGPSFADLGVTQAIVERMQKRGIIHPFPIQAEAIPDALDGRDILGKAKTGSGKTLAFGIPLVQRLRRDVKGTQALVLLPTRELCAQVKDELQALAPRKIKVLAAYGGAGLRRHIEEARHADIIAATPGRLIDLLERKAADLSKVHMLVFDEADRMADMGFLPQVTTILRYVPRERQTMLFSATLDSQIMGLISQTQDPLRYEVSDRQPTVEGLEHHLFEVHQMDKTDVLVALLKGPHGLTLVFTRTKRACSRLAKALSDNGVKAEAIHGDRTQAERERSLHRFEHGDVDVLVATDVAARGLDIEGVTLVVNYDLPEDHKAYVHRVGRTARAGKTGVAVTLATWEQRADVERMARRLRLTPHIVEVFSSDPVLQKVGTADVTGNPPAPEDEPEESPTTGAYARLRRTRGPGRRRR